MSCRKIHRLDVLAVAGHRPGSTAGESSGHSGGVATIWADSLSLSFQTSDRELAKEWFEDLAGDGLEGFGDEEQRPALPGWEEDMAQIQAPI